MNTITGHKGEAHVTAQQQRDIYAGIFGNESYVLNVGNKLSAELVNNNTIRIKNGVAVLAGGHAVNIDNGNYESVTIQNGTVGYNRIDIIAIHYYLNNDIEQAEIVVFQGEPSTDTAYSPDIPGKGLNPDGTYWDAFTIRQGALNYYFPIYRINISGTGFTSDDIIPLFDISYVINNISERKELSLNSTYFSNYYENNYHMSYKKSGDIVEITGFVKNIQTLPMPNYETEYIIATLPSDCRPASKVSGICQGSTCATFHLTIETDGSIKLWRYRNGNTLVDVPVGAYLCIHKTFMVN